MPHPVSIAPKPKVFTSDPLSAGPVRKMYTWYWWGWKLALTIGSGDVPGMFIKEYWTTDPPSQQWDVTAMVPAFWRMKEFWFFIQTTPNDLFFIIWQCSYRQQSQRRKQRLQWHTPLHRLRCNFNLIWFWKKKDLVMEGKTKLFQKYFFTFIIFCFFLPVANVDKVA